ncbi:interferon-induced very large GTPase 1-like isoform X2 [Paramormyrops kingsleyae]|uniref:interferon-induced very large GTPase 1-like isoform X2 n=1 Tax=Paramormyrops kingsleyae TaxID=1676925 RepID=UPI003B970DE1
MRIARFASGQAIRAPSRRRRLRITMWDLEDLKKDSDEKIQHNTEFDVIASDSVEDKAWALDVDASLKASFVGGLVEVGGSAKYLKDKKTSKKQARVTLTYKTTTKFRQLSMSHLGRGNVKHPYVFEKGIATHVVTAVLYGAQAFFVFDREVSESEDQQKIEGNLQVMIKKIPCLSIEGEVDLKLTDTDKATVEKFYCKFYGDFALRQNPVSFQDAVKVYTTLPGLLGENGKNAVPVRVWLLPLEILDSSAARLVRQISVRLINETQSVIDDFNEIEMQCNDIATRKVFSYFPEIGRKIKSFKDMCLEYKSVFQRSLSSILPLIRGGGTEECVLANILTKKEQSPFNSNKLKEWLDCKEEEINLLQVYTDMMEDTRILASNSELQSEILKNRDKNVVCFALTSLGEEEPYLSCLKSHLKALSTAKLTEPTEEDGKDVEPCEFYFSDAMSGKMKEQAILFIDFVKANKENKKTHFISASIPNDEHKGASIYLYKDGIKKSDHFEPPSKPERPNASDVTHDSVTIKLSHPQYGSSEITDYLVEYCANESDGWQFIKVPKSNLECTVSGLLPHTGYRFRYKAACPAGVSLTSEADSIKTLPTSPPGKPKQTYVGSEEIVVTWTKPDSIGHGVNIENYAVEYRTEANENKADWEKKTSKGEVCKITGLQPDTAYSIRIMCNCGEFGQSKESLTVSISTLSETSTVAEKIKRKSECLSQLGFSDLFPKKIKLNDILVIDHLSMDLNEPDTVEDLKSQYLYKLMILDYNARYLSFKPVAPDPPLEDDGTNFDDFDFFNTNEESTRGADLAGTESHIHPMDIHMAIFHCANDFLRQYMYTKLSACQFALPFLVPNPCTEDLEFPLWPLRHIKKSWQSMTSADNPGKYQTRQMFSTPVPVVSFLRLGTSFTSKSQILNSVISKQRHNVFFNRHCKGSAPNSMLMNGVVEIAWYCPGGKKDDIFDDCVAFLNLHGEAKDHQEQLQFLQAVSTVNVLVLSEQPQDKETKTISQNLSQSPVPLICLFSGSERVQGSKNPLIVRLAAKNRNEAELTEELITNIKRCIGKYNKKQSIENCSNEARKLKFKVDEDKQSFKDGHELAQTLVCLLKEKCISDMKKKFLPLQGELWHDWCLKNKQQYHLSCKTNESIEQRKSVILSDMEATRKKQREIALSHNDFMRTFLDCLTSSEHAEDTKFYMLQWLRVLLDELSSDHLARLEENYHSTWSQMRNVPKTKEKAEETDTLRKQLNSISEKMAASTIGLQHIMREVGQMYECSVKQSVGALPAIGAEMLISGYPLELMDGDESHVPLIWVQAVLKSLIEKLDDKKVYVLSILGLQSSGKSTLLKTMFGLQFTVSARRCTRGAFMQMIKVDEKIGEEFGFDFVLVVDTEGLRSPELSTKTSLNHDNELATFIIGIGDMTVINIMGENPSEMHEILQICVQAFLRMKWVEIKPSCIFVHQNVAEASAGDKNMEGRRRLQEKLDEMAQTAAKEEGIDDVYSFSDVIQFDLQSQVFYFKNLLEGDPPMAPPNPSYSQNVQDLKSKLLSVAKWQTGFRFPSLSQFRLRVHDLWNALLQENFVFSFRNTLEIMVYSSLEEKYTQWSWKLRKCSLETQTKLENQIGSNNISDVNTTDLISNFDEVYATLKIEIEEHFKEDKHAEILIKWKGNVENRLESLKNELIEETHKQCKMLMEIKKSMTVLDQKKSHYEKNLMQKRKTMATSLKDKRLSDKQVEEAFNSVWGEWVTEIANDQLPDEPVNIKSIVEAILFSRFQKQADLRNKIKKVNENGTFEFTKTKHISRSKLAALAEWPKEIQGKGIPPEFAEKLHQNVNHMVDEYIRKKELEKTDFNQNFIFEILDEVERHIRDYEQRENVKFTYEYTVDLSVLVCLGSVQRFQYMHESFKKANNPVTYLQSKKEQYSEMFKQYCKGANSVRIFAEFLFKNILPAVEEAIYNQIKLLIINIMKCNNPALSGNRCNLENHILRHLAIQEEFKSYTEYIDNPKLYFQSFIGEHVETFCKDYRKLQDMFHGNLEEIKFRILRICTEVSEEVNLKNGNASMWLDHFCTKLGDHMVINRQSLTSIQDEDIRDTKFLKDMMAKYLEEVVKSENMEKVDTSSQHLCLLKEKITEILFKQLEGCWAQCPFCNAICTNTMSNHTDDHRVQFHRSSAIGKVPYHKTDEFTIDFCTTNVSSDGSFIILPYKKRIPYKSYRDGGDPYDKWSITADGSTQGYWKWFVCRFQKEWGHRCGLKFKGKGVIPDSWRKITKESVLEELNIRD